MELSGGVGIKAAEIIKRIQDLYLADKVPWVVGYSGGKDSTATLQLVWYALSTLNDEDRSRKPVHVISTDTMVEQPIVAAWVNRSLELMKESAHNQDLPIVPHRLTPTVKDSYWVNLIGKGYPAPRPGFRWCTSRLKIQPSNQFILNVVRSHGETILVLGTRKAESVTRARVMEKYEKKRIRQWLSPNASLPNSWVFSPIEDWTDDEVWEYLLTVSNPWGRSNRDLFSMYRGANPDNECPLVVDTSTPSCGGSRFGCWVCTIVAEDKSMEAMIQNDAEKTWMTPLLEFRNELGRADSNGKIQDRDLRDFRRFDGSIKINHRDGKPIHGPYTKTVREYWLRRLLEVQQSIHKNGPTDMKKLELISHNELTEIRRIWLEEKHEFDDALPTIYEEVVGTPFETEVANRRSFGKREWNILAEICEKDPVFMELQATLLDIAQTAVGTLKPKGKVMEDLVAAIKKSYYVDEEDAAEFAWAQKTLLTIEEPESVHFVQDSWFDGLTS